VWRTWGSTDIVDRRDARLEAGLLDRGITLE